MDRFWSKVLKTDGCWEWQGAIYHTRGGYGMFQFQGMPHRAHRVSWELVNGPIPKGLWVLHKCDNPPCVNPDHLFLGTCQDNIDDRTRKGRAAVGEKSGRRLHPEKFVPMPGEKNPMAKLSKENIPEIKLLYRNGMSQRKIGNKYGVSRSTIWFIVSGKTWNKQESLK